MWRKNIVAAWSFASRYEKSSWDGPSACPALFPSGLTPSVQTVSSDVAEALTAISILACSASLLPDLLVPTIVKQPAMVTLVATAFPWEVTDKAALFIQRRRWTLSRRRAAQLNLLREKFMSGKKFRLNRNRPGCLCGGRSRRCRNEIR